MNANGPYCLCEICIKEVFTEVMLNLTFENDLGLSSQSG